MKTLLVIIDGAADVADASTEGLTPLQAADMPRWPIRLPVVRPPGT